MASPFFLKPKKAPPPSGPTANSQRLHPRRPEVARQNFLQALELYPNYAGAMLGMAYILFSEGKKVEALGYVEQAIGKGNTFEQLESDEDLAPLRALPEWAALMKKHFPDKVKD